MTELIVPFSVPPQYKGMMKQGGGKAKLSRGNISGLFTILSAGPRQVGVIRMTFN